MTQLVVLHALLVSCVQYWNPCHAEFWNVLWINWNTINRYVLQKGLNLLGHCRNYLTTLMGGCLCGDSKNSEPQRSVTFLLLFLSPSNPTEYRGGIESICLQSDTLRRKYSISETQWQETSYRCRIRQSSDLFPAQHHLLRKSMGSLRNFYCQVLQRFLGRYSKSRQKRQIANNSENRGEFITVSYKSSFSLLRITVGRLGLKATRRGTAFSTTPPSMRRWNLFPAL